MKQSLLISLLILLCSCSDNNSKPTDVHQKSRGNLVEITELITPVDVWDLNISSANVCVLGDKIILLDYRSNDNLIHILDKHNFQHLYSGVKKGRASNEITSVGNIAIDETNNKFLVTDHGKRAVLAFDIDSLILSTDYKPSVKVKLEQAMFPDKYQLFSDTLCYGVFVEPIGNNDFQQVFAAYNLKTGEVSGKLEYSPLNEKKRICGAVSPSQNTIVEAYRRSDLMTISDMQGVPQFNIFGPKYNSGEQSYYYTDLLICDSYIVASYSGKSCNQGDSFCPNILHIFDLEGNYIKSLHSEENILHMFFDAATKRMIISFDSSEMQLGYVDLGKILID